MKLQIASDLHLEFRRGWNVKHTAQNDWFNDYFSGNADILVLAGDVHHADIVPQVLETLKPRYQHIIYTPGNHEYYGISYNEHKHLIEDASDHAHVLDMSTTTINNQRFVGCTLWTNFDHDLIAEIAARSTINDFRTIADWSTSQCRTTSDYHHSYLNQVTKEDDIVVTHFLPRKELVDARYGSYEQVLVNKYFANNGKIPAPKLWIYGHTHSKTDVTIDETRYLCNPIGYPGEQQPQTQYLEI